MDAGRYSRVRSIFGDALGLAPAERETYVRRECGEDAELCSEVLSLLSRVPGPDEPLPTTPGARLRRHVEDVAAEAEENAPHPPSQPLPERIGNCVVIRCLGEGGMGVVYEAEQQSPHRRVAVKLMRADFGSSSLASRFRRESELLGRLEHPGIARVYEAGKARAWGVAGPEVPYLVMELVDGTPLTTYAARRNLGITERLELIAKICDAVQHAHERGVVHRDLKPANVLVDTSGQPRVLDFGVARALDADPQLATMHTGTSQLVGTLPYMSPEQLAGSDAVGPASDVYALGVLAYELLAGRRPLALAGLSLAEAVRQVQEVEPAPLSSFDARLGGDIDAIVGKALAKEPERRYGSAAEMAADIERHLSEEPIQARPPSAIYRASKFVRRNTAVVVVTISLVVVLVAGVIATAWFALREASSKRQAVAAAAEAEWAAHRADLAAAIAALDDGDARTARRLLDRTPERLRDWTWHEVESRLDDSVAMLTLDKARFKESVSELVVRDDGALVVRAGQVLAVVDTAADELRMASQPDGRWVAISRDGRRALELRDGRWIDRSTEDEAASVALGEAGEPTARALPAGGWIVSALHGIRVHDARGAVVATLDAPIGEPLATSPDGRWLVSDRDRDLRAIQLVNGGQVVVLGHRAGAVAFTPDGSTLLAADGDGHVRTFDMLHPQSGALKDASLAAMRIDLVAVPPHGDSFITVDRRGAVRAWHLGDDSLAHDLAALGYSVHAMAVRADGDAVLVSTASGAVQLLSLDGERVGTPRLGHEKAIAALAFLPGRKRIASVDGDGEIRLFLEPGALEPRRLTGHGSYVYGVAIDPAGTRVASIAWDLSARVWDLRTGALLRVLAIPTQAARAVCWMGNDRVATVQDGSCIVFDAATGATLAQVSSNAGPMDVAWDARRGRLLLAEAGGQLRSWDPATGETRMLMPPDQTTEGRIEILHGGDIAIVAHSNVIAAVDASDGRKLWQTVLPYGTIVDVAVDARDEKVAAGCVDGVIELLDARTGTIAARFESPGRSPVYAVAFHPSGRLLASGSQDGLVSTWNLDRGELVAQLRGHQDYVHGVAFTPDGTLLVSGSADATLRTWDSLPIKERLRR